MSMGVSRSFLFGILCIVLVLASGPVLAGPTIGLDSYEVDCNGHGPCERCDERCIEHGYKHGGGCYGFAQCCCVIN
ncbi:hypothetical protein MtrunA17_Chr7g0238311 [Medicago truncatula]|uniref:LCR-like protein n=1 Tax=Medicago truncatula TaxID=3880 RepID=A0A396GY65_MEDTR|nr:hypothetical protein MtrunA17_Chr7g0238311 [Medicago truncatula]